MMPMRAATLSLATMLAGLLSPACFNPPNDTGLTTFETFSSTSSTTDAPGTDGPGTTNGSTSGVVTSGVDSTGPGASSGESSVGSTGIPAECGDGIVGGDEACDDAGESATCDADCTAVECGDGQLNLLAGETCDDGGESAVCDADCTPAECGDAAVNATAGEACDDAGESATCDVDCTAAECGDALTNGAAGEQCDDGNGLPGDGCEGCLNVVACSGGAVMLGINPAGTMAVCDDPANVVCEQDVEPLCPAGWGLCTREQHVNRNDGFDFPLGGTTVVGEIHCRGGGGAGHYTISGGNLNLDQALNCSYGSSRPSCVTMYGCNETFVSALCCAPSPTCGNGVVDAPEELCDDANLSELDNCLDSCGWRVPAANGQPNCN